MDIPVRAAFWRAGTSRAVLFAEADLRGYSEPEQRGIILAALGSPDPYGRQIDGLGAGISSLSKAAVVASAPSGSDCDVTFRFAQVDVRTPTVEFIGNCGNVAAAIGPFALDSGLVAATDPETEVVVSSTNTGQRFRARVQTRQGRFEATGDFSIDGVPGTGSPIVLRYEAPSGSTGRGTLPTGKSIEPLTLPNGRAIAISIVDVANPVAFVAASDVGATGTEDPDSVDGNGDLLEVLEFVRREAAVRIGLAASHGGAADTMQAIPKVAFVAAPAAYQSTVNVQVASSCTDLVIRLISMGRAHRTLASTTGMCAAAAAGIAGTVVAQAVGSEAIERGTVRLGHPAGVMEVGARVVAGVDGTWTVGEITTHRTARRIMDGVVYVPENYLEGTAWFARP